MDTPLCKLTIISPRIIKPVIADVLDAMEPPLTGITMLDAEGRGAGSDLASTDEKVRGVMATAVFVMILESDRVQTVLDTIAKHCQRRKLAFWTEPVTDFGRLL